MLFANVGDDVVALNIEGGQCYGMDKIAGTVWGLLAETERHRHYL